MYTKLYTNDVCFLDLEAHIRWPFQHVGKYKGICVYINFEI